MSILNLDILKKIVSGDFDTNNMQRSTWMYSVYFTNVRSDQVHTYVCMLWRDMCWQEYEKLLRTYLTTDVYSFLDVSMCSQSSVQITLRHSRQKKNLKI